MSRKCKTVYSRVPRPYNKCVNVGNWFEERALEEDLLKDYLYKREHNMLLWQNVDHLSKMCFQHVPLSYSRDQLVRYGDKVMLINLPITNPAQNIKTLCMQVPESVLYSGCLDPSYTDRPIKDVCASETVLSPVNVSIFVIRGLTAALNGNPVRYGEVVFFYTYNEKLMLSSVKKTPIFRLRNISENNWVALTNECNYNCRFRLVPFDKSKRLELDGEPIKANARLLINHVETNENLCVEDDIIIRSAFNTVYEVSCKTKYDKHKLESTCNHWAIYMKGQGCDRFPIREHNPEDETCTPHARIKNPVSLDHLRDESVDGKMKSGDGGGDGGKSYKCGEPWMEK